MAQRISLASVVNAGSRAYMRETVMNRFNPSQADGLRNVNRSILHAMMDDFKGERGVRALDLSGKIASKYHLHKPESIYHATLLMVAERCPLVTIGRDGNAYSPREGKPSSKYITFSPTHWGEFMYKGKIIAPLIKNYSLSDEIPEYYPSLLPYWAFTNYTNIAAGISSTTLANNPKEVFEMMLKLVDNTEISTEELVESYRGPDVGPGYTVIGHPQSLYTMLEEGYAKYTVLANIEITRERVLIKEVPFRSTLHVLSNQLSGMEFETFRKGPPERIISSSSTHIMQFRYQLNDGYTLVDMQKELYDKTTLKKVITTEMIGLLPLNEELGDNRLNIVGLKEYMVSCLRSGFLIRQAEIEDEIANIFKEVKHNSLLEKLTRPEVLSWFQPLISQRGIREKQLFDRGNAEIGPRKIGRYIEVEGGITKDDVATTFKREGGNHILVNLDYRHTVVNELERLDDALHLLYRDLESENIIEYLKETLKSWIALPECTRVTNILFKDIDEALETKWEDTENVMIDHMIATDEHFNTPVNIIFYKDGTINYYNPKVGNNIPEEMMTGPIHTLMECMTGTELIIFNEEQRFKVQARTIVNHMDNFNDIAKGMAFYGVMEYPEDFNKTLVMVTNQNRVKRAKMMHLKQEIQSVKPFPLRLGEQFIKIYTVDDRDVEDITVETITAEGFKRRKLVLMVNKGVNGFVTLLNSDFGEETLDVRFCTDERQVIAIENGAMTVEDVDMSRVHLRDTLREVGINKKLSHFTCDKQYYTREGKLQTIDEVFGEVSNTIKDSPHGAVVCGELDYIPVTVERSRGRVEEDN